MYLFFHKKKSFFLYFKQFFIFFHIVFSKINLLKKMSRLNALLKEEKLFEKVLFIDNPHPQDYRKTWILERLKCSFMNLEMRI